MIPAPVGFQCPECVAAAQATTREPKTVFGGKLTSSSTVTLTLIGISAGVFLLQFLTGINKVAADWGMWPAGVAVNSEWYRLLTSVFLHGSWLHLLFNMYVLYVLGPPLERLLGHTRFLALYLIAGLGGAVASFTFSPINTVSVGASGAIFGLMGALVVAGRHLKADITQVLVLIGINVVIGFLAPGIDWRAPRGIARRWCGGVRVLQGAARGQSDTGAGARLRADRGCLGGDRGVSGTGDSGADPGRLVEQMVGISSEAFRLKLPAGNMTGMTRDAVICAAVRTPIGVGKPEKGALSGIHAVDLSALALQGLVDEAGIDPALIEDVIWGCVSQVGEQGFNIGRNAALAAGFPESVPGTTVDRQCGSSQQALHFAAATVMAGQYDVVVAGGVESMSRIPMFSNGKGGDGPFGPMMVNRYDGKLVNQGVSAEMIAAKWNLSREYLDELAVESHERAARATIDGLFAEEIVPVGEVTADQGIRPGSSVEKLAGLPTPFQEGGVVTAGNASQISDGSAALLVTTSEKAAELGLTPIVRFHTGVMAGVDPIIMLTGPIPATAKVLERSGLRLDEIGAVEINEAFGSVVGAWFAETGADPKITNPNGGAIALGHPLGATGAIRTATLVHGLARTGGRYGLVTMCVGTGMGAAGVFEKV